MAGHLILSFSVFTYAYVSVYEIRTSTPYLPANFLSRGISITNAGEAGGTWKWIGMNGIAFLSPFAGRHSNQGDPQNMPTLSLTISVNDRETAFRKEIS